MDSDFVALARNAFDVLMRRREWQVIWFGDWCVVDLTEDLSQKLNDEYMKCCQRRFNNHFEALVAADAWVKEHVEAVKP